MLPNGLDYLLISIHAPHARSDLLRIATRWTIQPYFNPRSSCEERPWPVRSHSSLIYFNPRSSCEERHPLRAHCGSLHADFNPRSSCEERHGLFQVVPGARNFNPRSSCEERPGVDFTPSRRMSISIHAPHARSDAVRASSKPKHWNFNPRSSCEERLCHFQALICLTSSYIFREPLASFRKHFF